MKRMIVLELKRVAKTRSTWMLAAGAAAVGYYGIFGHFLCASLYPGRKRHGSKAYRKGSDTGQSRKAETA
jgi:hypothetical protein